MTIVSTLRLLACARTCCGPGRRLNGERTLLGAEDSKNKKDEPGELATSLLKIARRRMVPNHAAELGSTG